jgi:hypothetical protein
MEDQRNRSNSVSGSRLEDELGFLTRQTVRRVDEALCQLGPYGEVRLVVMKGRLRFIQTVRSEEVDGMAGRGGVS